MIQWTMKQSDILSLGKITELVHLEDIHLFILFRNKYTINMIDATYFS